MSNVRLYLVLFLMTGLALAVCLRLFDIQIMSGGKWSAQARGQQIFFEQTTGDRGEIYMMNKKGDPVPLAINRVFFHAYISPREISEEEKEETAIEIAEVLDLNKDFVLERMNRDSSYEILKRKLTEEEAEQAGDVDNVYMERDVMRYYPQGNFASHVIGFVDREDEGRYGIEQHYDSIMQGREGIKEGRRGSGGFFITRDTTERGLNVMLTLDYNVQHFTENVLRDAYDEFNSSSASIVVGDPNTGRIIAMASNPGFNPNHYSEVKDFSAFKNQTVQSFFEPGSVFKPITMAGGIDAMVVEPDDTYEDEGHVRIHGRTIHNYGRRTWGEVSMTDIMRNSINTGIVEVGDRLGQDLFLEYMEDFGFFEKTGIDTHGEVASENKNILERHDVNFATAAYGHGIQVTTIQLFRAFSVLANGGDLIVPYITQGMGSDSRESVLSSSTISKITPMLVASVDEGSGWRAGVPGYYVAGKTGTSQIPYSVLGIQKSGYSDETIQTFVGYAPAYDPEFVVVVRLDQPNTPTAELSAAPVAGDVIEYMLKYKQIPPDYHDPKE